MGFSRYDVPRTPTWVVSTMAALSLVTTAFAAEQTLRIATYNASLYGERRGEVQKRLGNREDRQAKKVAAIVQTVRPDILLINEIDYDTDGRTARLLAENYFAVSQDGREPVLYPHVYAVPSNTGLDSQLDVNRNGDKGEAEDAWGYGTYPGQYAMAIYSRYPIDRSGIRTFQRFRWKDLPGALRPIHPVTRRPYYDDATWNELRLSSKNHVDVPIIIQRHRLHLLASHPTPPVFDGEEDHNGCRNHDEIRFWIDYLSGPSADHLVDDQGNKGGLREGEWFTILGDLNSDPHGGESRRSAIAVLLEHPRLLDPQPTSEGASDVSDDESVKGNRDTADFGSSGTMRVDYVLPSRQLKVKASGVFWPAQANPASGLIDASDHRLVWIEVTLP